MTVIEYSAVLIKYFSENDCLFLSSFDPKDDFLKVMAVSEDLQKDYAGLEAALSLLEKSELVKKQSNSRGNYWFLNKSFKSFEQTVTIDSQLTLSIAEVINGFCVNQSDKTDFCDPANISQKDIRNLVLLVIYYSNKLDSQTTN